MKMSPVVMRHVTKDGKIMMLLDIESRDGQLPMQTELQSIVKRPNTDP